MCSECYKTLKERGLFDEFSNSKVSFREHW